MIDKHKVKAFWDNRAETYKTLPFESVANLEQDPANLELKIETETQKVFGWLPDLRGKSVLDLGAGVGQWSFRFAELGASRVLAVEYSDKLVEIGRTEAAARGVTSIEFRHSSAESFTSEETFDVVFISGLFVYMEDAQANHLASHLRKHCTQNSVLMLRDGTAVRERYEISDRYSSHLDALYSAVYRTRAEYVRLLEQAGFALVQDENMFEEGHPLNKYPETRLRVFLFRPQS